MSRLSSAVKRRPLITFFVLTYALAWTLLLHATFDLPITLSMEALGSRAPVPLLLYWGLLVVAAIVVVIVAGPKHLSRKLRKQEERAVELEVTTPGVVKPIPA